MPPKKSAERVSRRCAWAECGKTFRPRQQTQRFHSAKCRMADWAAKHPRVALSE